MSPQDIPYMLCGFFCLVPFAAGLAGWLVPFLFSKRLPFLQVTKQILKGRKHLTFELSLETRETIRAMKKTEKPKA